MSNMRDPRIFSAYRPSLTNVYIMWVHGFGQSWYITIKKKSFATIFGSFKLHHPEKIVISSKDGFFWLLLMIVSAVNHEIICYQFRVFGQRVVSVNRLRQSLT